MPRQLFLVLVSTALAATLAVSAAAQEYSTGNGRGYARGRGPAVLTPVEAFGVHPPGPDPAYSLRRVFFWWRKTYTPYYAPASPTATSTRWKPWCNFFLMPYYTPYYPHYSPWRAWHRKPPPYGGDGGWGRGPMPDHPFPPNPEDTPLRYGGYTDVLSDDTTYWNMGGNGLTPYGTPTPRTRAPDLVDAIRTTRSGEGNGSCAPPLDEAGPAIAPPTENEDENSPK